ncbi:MAG: [acyl-carrier-protein] S-malonyltransferase [Gaiellales bacterium]|nr:[acyl-carrier-protein] S-malonyltransferase [Gaiellales bacterium]
MSGVAFCFPGQGSQRVGMGKELAEAFPEAAAVFEQASRTLGFDLAAVCFDGPLEELSQTEITQPALVAASLAALHAVEGHSALRADVVVGHSVGEYAALAAAGSLSLSDVIGLVRARGLATGASTTGGMAAVLGLPDAEVERLCSESDQVWPANYNCPGQIVISGSEQGVADVSERAKAAGGKAIRLRVSGAFHSPLMAGAAAEFEPALASVTFGPLSTRFMSTVTSLVETVERVPELLVEQLTAPVRFTRPCRRWWRTASTCLSNSDRAACWRG